MTLTTDAAARSANATAAAGGRRGTAILAIIADLARAQQNGLSQTELKEMIIHLAFYAGWPRAMSAITLAKELFTEPGGDL